MLDGLARRALDPLIAPLADALAARGARADAITLAGAGLGLAAAGTVWAGAFPVAVLLLLASRLCDALDGAVAARTARTPFGGFLDITLDFGFYGAIPLAFALHDPAGNGLAAAILLFAFYVNGASFLALAAVARDRGLTSAARGEKSLYFTTGLAEASETILVFVAMCLVPRWFPALALGFAALTLVTAGARILLARRLLA